jgi:RNA methyltransferase, TrmH family
MTETITSAANPLVKRIRLLADRKHRRREGAFVVEGPQPVWRAVSAGWEIEALVVVPEMLAGSAAERMVAEQAHNGVRVVQFSRELFTRMSERDGPAGVAAIVRSRTVALADLTAPPGAVFAALHRVSNPGNLGTIIRTVDAVGGAGVILIGNSADPYAPTAVKASMGSLFGIAVAHAPDAGTFFEWARDRAVATVATSGYADQEHWDVDYRAPLAILLGNEGDGLPEEVLARADLRIRIPMVGTAESLNLAVAAGVMLYEARRRQVGRAE